MKHSFEMNTPAVQELIRRYGQNSLHDLASRALAELREYEIAAEDGSIYRFAETATLPWGGRLTLWPDPPEGFWVECLYLVSFDPNVFVQGVRLGTTFALDSAPGSLGSPLLPHAYNELSYYGMTLHVSPFRLDPQYRLMRIELLNNGEATSHVHVMAVGPR